MAPHPVTAVSKSDNDIAPHKPPKVSIQTVGPQITCHLCQGYLIDATTIVECLHSFCHSCIMKHLRAEQYCPICEMMINKAKPNIKRDATLQAIVYKLVPGLYEKELLRRRAFYKLRPEEAAAATPEQRGDDTEHLIFGPTEKISLSLEYSDVDEIDETDRAQDELKHPKYLQCPAVFTVQNLKKFVLFKYGIDTSQFCVEIMYKVKTIVLPDHYTLMDVAYIYTWKRDAPMRFFYRVRTNEPSSEEELPEVPLRRSPSISDRNSVESSTAQSDSETVTSDDSVPPTTTLIPSASPIVAPLTPQPDPPTDFVRPQVPTTPLSTTAAPPAPLITSSPLPFPSVASPVPMTSKNTQVQKLILPNTSAADSRKSSSESVKSPKVKTPKSEEKLAKQAARVAKKAKEDVVVVPEKRVENIKLKIEQNSVTIVKSTTKDLKIMFKKDREHKEQVAKAQLAKIRSEHKAKKKDIASIKLAKVSERSDSVNGEVKYEIKSPVTDKSKSYAEIIPKLNVPPKVQDEEEKKSVFLNSFQLTPTKSLSPEKLQQIDAQIKANQLSPKMYEELKQAASSKALVELKPVIKVSLSPPAVVKPTTTTTKSDNLSKIIAEVSKTSPTSPKSSPTTPKPSPTSPKSNDQSNKTPASNKRKNKEPSKTPAKKSRSKSPEECMSHSKISPFPNLPEITLKRIDVPSEVVPPNKITIKTSTMKCVEKVDKPLMRPPLEPTKPKDVFAKPLPVTSRNADTSSAEKKHLSVKPIDKLMPKTTPIINNIQRPTQSDTPRPNASTPKQNRPESSGPAKKLSNIAPKVITSMPPPMVPPIYSSHRTTEAEIKHIKQDVSTKDIKVFGPLMEKHPLAIKAPGSSSPAYVPSYTTIPKQNGNSSGYLNYALLNSHKRASETPLGNRTPVYAPNSPSYTPNYNISPYPQFKYMKSLPNMTNYFPTPPVNTAPKTTSSTKQPEELNKRLINENSQKRPNTSSASKDNDSPPEKQQKVQSLLDSCKINFPPSLSITLHEQKDPKSNQSLFQAMQKSPVNNYIEIVKLPDLPTNEDLNKNQSSNKPASSPPKPNQSMNMPLRTMPQPFKMNQNAAPITVTSTSSQMQYMASPQPTHSQKSPNAPATNRSPADKKTVPELTPIERFLKPSYQEKFINSLDDPKAKNKAKVAKPKKDQKMPARRNSIAHSPKDITRYLTRIAPKLEAQQAQKNAPTTNSTIFLTTKSATSKPASPKPIVPPKTSPRPATTSSSTAQKVQKTDDALDLTSNTNSVPAKSRRSPINHNNNDKHKKSTAELMPPPAPIKQSPAVTAAIYAAALARATPPSNFNMTQNLAAVQMQQHIQNHLLLEHLNRLKAGEHFAEVLANYNKFAAESKDEKPIKTSPK